VRPVCVDTTLLSYSLMSFGVDNKDETGHCRRLASNLTLDGASVEVKSAGGTTPLFAKLERVQGGGLFFSPLTDVLITASNGFSFWFMSLSVPMRVLFV
jgi:hypothetical protein